METYNLTELVFKKNLANQLQRDIVGEILKAVKLTDNGLSRAIIGGLTELPTRRFSEIMADFDRVIGENGLQHACDHILNKLLKGTIATGIENIPIEGPVVIASNHPGTFDAIAIVSKIPRRDVKIIVGVNPFFQNLSNGSRFLIFATRDNFDRMDVIRKAIQHLQHGGLLLIFPYGHIAPDPAILPGADEHIKRWSCSLEIFLRKVPSAELVLTIISGVISNDYVNHPLPNMFSGFERRRIIEFMQVIKQMIRHQRKNLHPKISFQKENRTENVIEKRMNAIRQQAVGLLDSHMQEYYPG